MPYFAGQFDDPDDEDTNGGNDNGQFNNNSYVMNQLPQNSLGVKNRELMSKVSLEPSIFQQSIHGKGNLFSADYLRSPKKSLANFAKTDSTPAPLPASVLPITGDSKRIARALDSVERDYEDTFRSLNSFTSGKQQDYRLDDLIKQYQSVNLPSHSKNSSLNVFFLFYIQGGEEERIKLLKNIENFFQLFKAF